MIKTKPKTEKQAEIVRPPRSDGPWLLYGGFWYPVDNFEFNADQWSGFEIVPTDKVGPFFVLSGHLLPSRDD